ncbi:S16 family peptidase [Lentilactobacillus senioris DSM 24302 = JCM 17472]|uniref:S16 family peptidase n=1 Tax=Lentilactobacillus senioris DSM 24302 = JCM 17472 TaxID=1423802 RepID=A0A0R2D0J1_9LACO|nr:SepM family pheromone-processing serine protease [Lentilactobacillus senioris]KRM94043.1 S16 family peptidase [Lentilactobacillus senioris DSM 24302 = JCM 17472]
MKRKWPKSVFWWLIGILLLAAFLFWPLPKYIEGPGQASDINNFVKIKNHPDKRKGSFMLTSVGISQARPLTYLWAKMVPYYTIEDANDVTSGQNMVQYEQVQKFYMQSSINEAIFTAYKSAHQDVERKYNGIYVLDVQKNSKFKSKLAVGDVVTAIDGHHFKNSSGFVNYIKGKKAGTEVTISYERNGINKTAREPLVKISKQRAGIGIILTDNMTIQTKIPVKVNPGDVGGPSGGTMFALQIYGQLTNQDLRHGQKIAGTGTIDAEGNVGEIGGIDKKIIAAKRSGAKIFLAPYIKPTKSVLKFEPDHLTNYQLAKKTAKKYAPNMKVVPISTFEQAVSYLRNQKD